MEDEFDTSKPGLPFHIVDHNDVSVKRQTYPYNIICRLRMTYDKGPPQFEYGTGSLIHPRVLITCGHNFYSYHKKPQLNFEGKVIANEVTVTPEGGFSNSSQAVKVIQKGPNANVFLDLNWMKIVDQAPKGNFKGMTYTGKSRAYDYAFLLLDSPFNYNKYFTLKFLQNLNSACCCCGVYPDPPGQDQAFAFKESDSSTKPDIISELNEDIALKIDPTNKRSIIHKLDTFGGNSGSPIYQTDNQGNCSIIGIHNLGIRDSGNYATRVDEKIINGFKSILQMRNLN